MWCDGGVINTTLAIILQYISVSDQKVVNLKLTTMLYVIYVSLKSGEENRWTKNNKNILKESRMSKVINEQDTVNIFIMQILKAIAKWRKLLINTPDIFHTKGGPYLYKWRKSLLKLS